MRPALRGPARVAGWTVAGLATIAGVAAATAASAAASGSGSASTPSDAARVAPAVHWPGDRRRARPPQDVVVPDVEKETGS